MARILITGAAEGLGLGAARELKRVGHDVIVHARSPQRVDEAVRTLGGAAGAVCAELSDLDATCGMTQQVADLGGVDAIIHNAGVTLGSAVVPVNVVAPYVLSALVPARRLVFLSSSMHKSGKPTVSHVDWSGDRSSASYADTKLLVTALAAAVGQRRPDVYSNAVDPGWVPTRMGGTGAPDDLELGHRTQAWLAAGGDVRTRVSAYWHHQQVRTPHPAATDPQFQEALLDALASHTGVALT